MSHYPSGHEQRLVSELLHRLRNRNYGSNESEQKDYLAEEQLENRLLNKRALTEYEIIIGRLVDCADELNKYLKFDEEFKISAYQNCTSLRFRNRILVVEFKQVPFNDAQIHHSLDLIFQISGVGSGNAGRTTLVLARQRGEFVWRQLPPIVHAPAVTSKDLAASLLRWLDDGTDVF